MRSMVLRSVTLVFLIAIAFVSGYQVSKRKPLQVNLSYQKITAEVRDDSFKKCKSIESVGRTDGHIEELWQCPKVKVFIVKNMRVAESKISRPSRD